jgi:hypothetical protein
MKVIFCLESTDAALRSERLSQWLVCLLLERSLDLLSVRIFL